MTDVCGVCNGVRMVSKPSFDGLMKCPACATYPKPIEPSVQVESSVLKSKRKNKEVGKYAEGKSAKD